MKRLGIAIKGFMPTASRLTNRQDAISRVSAVQESAELQALIIWQLKRSVTSPVNVVKGWQRQLHSNTAAHHCI